MISIKKTFFAVLAVLTGLSVISCAVNEDNFSSTQVQEERGAVSLSFAIPKFMKPRAATSARMIMPSTRVIKFYIYSDAEQNEEIYSKEIALENSGESEDFTYVTASLDDVPVGTYAEGTMRIELYDSKVDFILTCAVNDSEVEVTSEGDPASVTFYALPESFYDITDEFVDEDDDGVYETDSYTSEILLDEDTLAGYDIYFEAYQVTVPSGYGLDVKFNASNPSGKEVSVVVYDEQGVASDADITVLTDTEIQDAVVAQIPTSYDDTYYVVLYANGVLEGLGDADCAILDFTLTEEE